MKKDKIEAIKRAFATFKEKMTQIRKSQLVLLDKIDRVISREQADKIRAKINNN